MKRWEYGVDVAVVVVAVVVAVVEVVGVVVWVVVVAVVVCVVEVVGVVDADVVGVVTWHPPFSVPSPYQVNAWLRMPTVASHSASVPDRAIK